MAGRPLPRNVSLEPIDRSSAAGPLDSFQIVSPLAYRRHVADCTRFCFSAPILALVTDDATINQSFERACLALGAAEAGHGGVTM